MQRIAPFQLEVRDTVLEHGRTLYCTISTTLCTCLETGEPLLPLAYYEQIAACQDDGLNLDIGMPKPQGEYLVTGSFHAPGGVPTESSEVEIAVGGCVKRLLVFGERHWQSGMATTSRPVNSISLGYSSAFGGQGYAENPLGLGFEDGRLPHLEDPGQRISRAGQQPAPAALGVVGLDWPQRRRYLGTYDNRYREEYFPGYPPDFDWRHFLAAGEDQRISGFWQGDEPYRLLNMHPRKPLIQGQLPGLVPRCFLRHSLRTPEPVFGELPLHLDTLWFFPEQLLVLQIWRGVLEVNDDEASAIHQLLACYEDRRQPPRDPQYYRRALEERLAGADPLRTMLATGDLIPAGHPSAMELLLDMAGTEAKPSALTENIAAKEASLRREVDRQVEDATRQAKAQIADNPVPGQEPLDLDRILARTRESATDPDQAVLNQRLEELLPGITKGGSEEIDLKNFSFAAVDQMLAAVQEFSAKKEEQAKTMARGELAKAIEDIRGQLDQGRRGGPELPPGAGEALTAQLEQLEAIDLDHPPPSPLPRVDGEEFLARLEPIDPMLQEAIAHLHSMQTLGVDNESCRSIQEHIDAALNLREGEMAERLRQAEGDFKEAYLLAAHFLEQGTSPHKRPLAEVRDQFFQALAAGEDLRERDWACLDLSGAQLDQVDLSGCYLEQVNFQGASLKGAVLCRAILARAILDEADCSGADLSQANLGGCTARKTRFVGANLHQAKLSRGNFAAADFTSADLRETESLEFACPEAVFSQADLSQAQFIQRQFAGVRFTGAAMEGALFFECSLNGCDFSQARLNRSIWADSNLAHCSFAGAELKSACFVATEKGNSRLTDVHFPGACLERSTMQNLQLPFVDLSASRLSGALFNGCDLSGARLTGAQALESQFRKADLNGADLAGIDLRQGSLAKARLTNANFAGANLYGVDFLRCTLGNTDFTGANLDATILEKGDGQ